jgi:hypothetical protein
VGTSDAALLPLAESIADGNPIDWHAVAKNASAEEQAVIRQLRILAVLAMLHRSLAEPDQKSRSTACGPASAR